MKKEINNYHDLIEWSADILLDVDFLAKVSCPQVTYYFSDSSFNIDGRMTMNPFDLSELPPVLKEADALFFSANHDILKFHAHYHADEE